MLEVTKGQLHTFRERQLARVKAQTYDDLQAEFPPINEDEPTVRAWLDELCDDGFETRKDLYRAARTLFLIGLRADPMAAEARATATAILQDRSQSPSARLSFLEAQKLTEPPQ